MQFPETATLRPKFGYSPSPMDHVMRSESDSGKSQNNDLWGRLRHMFSLQFSLSLADYETLMAFYETYRATSFKFYDHAKRTVYRNTLATGNGVLTTFTIPGKETSAVSVWINNVLKATPANYTISVGTGADGEDRVVTAVAVPNGQLLEIEWYGRKRYTVEFIQPPQVTFAKFNRLELGLSLREVF